MFFSDKKAYWKIYPFKSACIVVNLSEDTDGWNGSRKIGNVEFGDKLWWL